MKKWLAYGGMFLVALWLPTDVGVSVVSRPPIGFIGDSITIDASGGQTPAAVAAALLGTTALNRGVSGTTTTYWLPGHAPLRQAIAAFRAAHVRTVHLMLGTNDANVSHRILPAQYGANLQAIATTVRAAGMRLVVSDSPYAVMGVLGNRINAVTDARLRAYRAQIAALARAGLLLQGDTAAYATFASQPWLLKDGVHPDARGVRMLGALWAAAIAPTLRHG